MTRWVGRDAVPALLADVFGVEDRTQLKQGKASLPLLDNEYSERVRAGKFKKKGGSERDLHRGFLTWSSGGEVSGSQVKGRRVDYASHTLHCQGRRRAEPEAMGTNIAGRGPSGPRREHRSVDKQAPRKGEILMVSVLYTQGPC